MMDMTRRLHEPWAVAPLALEAVLALTPPSTKTLQSTVQRSAMQVQDAIAVIPVTGLLFRHNNWFTALQGTSTYTGIAQAFTHACQDPAVKAIVLDIDSPGGEVNGCASLANTLYQGRGCKPIVAVASGDCASGAYWLASACDQLIVSETSSVGSIGVVAAYHTSSQAETVDIVSSQSPHKRLDPTEDNDRARLQTRIDTLAEVMINAIARQRDVSPTVVVNQFGQGDVFIGQQAVMRGLADSVGNLEQQLDAFITTLTSKPIAKEEPLMDSDTLQQQHPDVFAAILNQGRVAERERIQAIVTADAAQERDSLAQHLAFATELDVEAAMAALQAAPEAKPISSLSDFENHMASLANPKVPIADEPIDEAEALAKRIAQVTSGGVA